MVMAYAISRYNKPLYSLLYANTLINYKWVSYSIFSKIGMENIHVCNMLENTMVSSVTTKLAPWLIAVFSVEK